jgi:hypothetical protein
MNPDVPGRVTALVSHETGYDVDGMLRELEEAPKKYWEMRQKVGPLLAEKRAIEDRYISRGRSPSLWDVERSLLLSELKQEARDAYSQKPDYKTDAKGNQVKIELTDGRAEDIAHAALRYRTFVDDTKAERRRARELKKELGKLFDKLEAWKLRREYLKIKLEQIKAETYLLNGQARL